VVAGSLERALTLAEAMETRGFGRVGRTRAPSPPWTRIDRLGIVAALLLPVGALWL
jgi:energy-coupling factor transporter transmembrane protein EcfT